LAILNVAGIVLLRLIKDVNEVGLDDLTLRAFQDAGFPSPPAQLCRQVRRALLGIFGVVRRSRCPPTFKREVARSGRTEAECRSELRTTRLFGKGLALPR